MNKKKIIHIIPAFDLGGVQTGILYSLEELNKVYDYQVLVMSWVDTEMIKNLPPHVQQYFIQTGSVNAISGSFKAYRILKKLKPDILICSLWKAVMVSVVFKFFNPKVSLFGFYHLAYATHIIGDFFLKILALRMEVGLADSEETKKFVEKRFKLKNVFTIPYNFPFSKTRLHKDQFNPSAIKMAYFGRLTEIKGIDRDIAFCRLCKSAGINFIFDLYGEGATKEYAKNNYAEKIEQLGLAKEVTIKKIIPPSMIIEKMHQYDFLLQLSNREGMAVSVVEALSSGLVPIVTPVGEIGNYSKDGLNAIWLDPPFDENLQSLLGKLKNVIGNPGFYDMLSLAGTKTFAKYKKYNEAMIEAIEGCSKSNSNA
jgi:glycosyltransferase involved in cell wall biosynthesis